ncbi:MAG: TlpA family protein disulfide reductase [Dehalococcoidia bacterium]|nr:TlpA family protein disulfide reductase [Dehalococcoidia bacterium]
MFDFVDTLSQDLLGTTTGGDVSHHTLSTPSTRTLRTLLARSITIGLLAAACGGASAQPSETPTPVPSSTAAAPVVGARAPDVTLPTREGGTFRRADARGKAVVLNFWASWCAPCREEMPRFERASRDLADRVVFVGVNATTLDSRAAALDFADQLDVTFPLVFDEDGRVGGEYGVSALPATFFIDADGVLRAIALGPVLADRLRENLALVGVR